MAYDEKLEERIKKVLKSKRGIVIKKMFGGAAFMMKDKMFCGIIKNERISMNPRMPRIMASAESPKVLFMPGVFEETMRLLTEAHEYFHLFGADDQAHINNDLRTLYSCEMSRITLRLSSIMAWLMAQRAVFTGKIPPEEMHRYGLDFQDICRVDNRVLHGVLPSYVCLLLDRSLELYERVLRLDSQMKRPH